MPRTSRQAHSSQLLGPSWIAIETSLYPILSLSSVRHREPWSQRLSEPTPISHEMEEKKQVLYQKTLRQRPLLDKAVIGESICQLREEKEPA